MTPTDLTRVGQASAPGTIRSTIRSTGRRGLIAAGAVIVAAGLALNWSWLVAAGIAPVLLSVLPCVAMCALGLCMNRKTGRSCSAEGVAQKEGTDIPKVHSADMEGRG